MNDKELDELLEYNQEYMEARLSEDVFGGDYTSEVELKHLKKDYDKLQSNWNSLRKLIEKEMKKSRYNNDVLRFTAYEWVLDKMGELESSDNK